MCVESSLGWSGVTWLISLSIEHTTAMQDLSTQVLTLDGCNVVMVVVQVLLTVRMMVGHQVPAST